MNQTQKIYTPQQVADLLGYKVSSIYAFISRKELLASKIGRSREISRDQLNEFIASKKSLDAVIDYSV
jgi:excisionase family DNA binding protein